MSLDAAKTLLNDLNGKFESGDVVGGKETLSKLKIALLDANPDDASWQAIAMATYEIGVLLTVADGDLDAFARNVAQLKPYYDATTTLAGSSAASATAVPQRKHHVLGLNLMHLLVENRLSEFHSELELLSDQDATNPFVSFPINLERQLMVGIYDEVLNVQVPDPSFQFFVDNLLQTVRDSIADCVEVSYKSMTVQDACNYMKFTSKEELHEYIQECRDDWIIENNNDTIIFQPPPSGSNASDIPSMDLIAKSLTYATEMERII